MNLLRLTEPELVLDEKIAYTAQHLLSVVLRDSARGNDHVADILRVGHDVPIGIDIIVVAIVSLHSDNRQALRQVDVDTPCLGLITLCRLYKRILEQRFLYLASVSSILRPCTWSMGSPKG